MDKADVCLGTPGYLMGFDRQRQLSLLGWPTFTGWAFALGGGSCVTTSSNQSLYTTPPQLASPHLLKPRFVENGPLQLVVTLD